MTAHQGPVGVPVICVHGDVDDTVPLRAVMDWARPQSLPVVVGPGGASTGLFLGLARAPWLLLPEPVARLRRTSPSLIEASMDLGADTFQTIRYVILPQAGILSLPSLFANFIFLLKETTVVSAVAVPEILYTTKSYIALYYKTYEMLAVLTLICVLLFLPLSLLLSRLERRLQHGQFGS